MEVGRHITAALDEQRAQHTARGVASVPSVTGNAWESGVHTVLPPARYPAPDDRQLYEQIGAVYVNLEAADGEWGATDSRGTTRPGVDEFTDFLDTVRHALLRPEGDTAAALRRALTRYEHDRTGA